MAPSRPWYRRLATPWGTPEVDLLPAARTRAAPALRIPIFRALLLPVGLGVFFSLVSLVVGVDLGGRLRAWLPHRTHVVRPGETLSSIAARYGIESWRELHAAGSNQRRYPSPDRIPAGARLDLPYRAALVPTLELPGCARLCSSPTRALLHALGFSEPAWAARLCDGAGPRPSPSRA